MKPEFLWYTQCPAPTPLSLAAQKGFLAEAFAAEELEVRSIRSSSDPEVRASHYTHALDWSFRQGGNIPAIWAKAGGRDTRVIAITTTDEFQALVALPQSGLTAVEHLKGKRIGIPQSPRALIDFQRATSLKGVISGLSLAGLSAKDVTLSPLEDRAPAPDIGALGHLGLDRRLPYGLELLAAARGEIDTFFVKGAEGLILAAQFNLTILAEFGFHPDAKIRVNNGTPRPLTLDQGTISQRPDLARRLIEAVLRIPPWAQAHPDDAIRLIAREIGVSEAAVKAANGPQVAHNLQVSLTEEQIEALQHFIGFLASWGFINQEFSAQDWVDPTHLYAAIGA